jgi:hypothetical protein
MVDAAERGHATVAGHHRGGLMNSRLHTGIPAVAVALSISAHALAAAPTITVVRALFPTVQQRSGTGRLDDAALPYALTNPVFVDVAGDSRISPIWAEAITTR